MYLGHFGLREFPFTLTPNTEYFYSYADHQEALNVLLFAIRSGEGFIKLTGEVGTGKTLLCRKVLNALKRPFRTAYIPNPHLTPSELIAAFAEELDIEIKPIEHEHHLQRILKDRLIELRAKGEHVVLMIDEAQALPLETLEAVRLLTNLETERSKLVQVVLFGQPELDKRLNQPGLRQLKQRITFSYRLRPMNREGTYQYLEHRLNSAGCKRYLFTKPARWLMFAASGGVPRLLNIFGHKAMLAAFGRGQPRVSIGAVWRAVKDTEGVSLDQWRI
jgi:MSHA biogenesis protein MshM